MSGTDGQLVQRTLDGDKLAFGELVDRYRHMVYGLGYHLTGEFEAARDLAQEAFIQAYLKLGQLRDPKRFAGWLRRIALNVRRTQVRTQTVATVTLEDEAALTAQAPPPSKTESAVRDALGSLLEPDRLALTLHYIDGYSCAEIAGFLGVLPDAVKTRLARARRRLKKEITTLVEETFDREHLPEDFTAKTVAEALRYQLAWQSLEAGETEVAMRMYAALLEEDTEADVRARVHNNLGCLYHDKLGDPGKGREHLRLAAETADAAGAQPSGFFHWRIYGWVALRDHEWREAIDAASRIVDKAPTDFERRNLHVLLAAAKSNLHQPEEAIEHLAAAAIPGPEPPGADRWPFRVPAAADPLDWVRANRAEFFPTIASDPRLEELVGKEP